MSVETFAVRYDVALRPLLAVLGTGPRWSGIEVGDEQVRVRMGWAFRAAFPRSAVRSAALDHGWVGGWGVHGWRGRWLVNGSSEGLVRIDLDPARRAWVMGLPVRLRTLRVSTTEPERLVARLTRS